MFSCSVVEITNYGVSSKIKRTLFECEKVAQFSNWKVVIVSSKLSSLSLVRIDENNLLSSIFRQR